MYVGSCQGLWRFCCQRYSMIFLLCPETSLAGGWECLFSTQRPVVLEAGMHYFPPRSQSGWRLGCKIENPSATVLGLDQWISCTNAPSNIKCTAWQPSCNPLNFCLLEAQGIDKWHCHMMLPGWELCKEVETALCKLKPPNNALCSRYK